MLNTVSLMGRITKEIELRYTASQKPVVSFSIACDRDFQGEDGKRATDFIDCVAWNNTATFINNYFSKGDLIGIAGRLQIRDWTDKEGNKRRSAEVLVEHAYFAQNRSSGNVDSGGFEELADEGELPF